MSINVGNRRMVSLGPLVVGNAAGVALAGGGGVSYDADAVTLFAAMSSEPDATRKALISDTIVGLKSAGIWDKLDALWFMAAHDAQAGRLNWINPGTHNLTAVDAPTFTVDEGYAGNGTTSHLDTNYVPSTDAVKFTLNDASIGFYMATHAGTTTRAPMGARDTTASTSPRQCLVITTTFTVARLNVDNNADQASDLSVATGLHVAQRTDANTVQIYRGGSLLATGTRVSQAVPQYSLFIGASNGGGSAGLLDNRQFSMAMAGASLTAQQQGDLNTIVQSYLDGLPGET